MTDKKQPSTALRRTGIEGEEKENLLPEKSYQVNFEDLVELLPESWRVRAEKVPEELRNMESGELRKMLTPSSTLNRVRLAFWYEFDRVRYGSKKKFSIKRALGGLVSEMTLKRMFMEPMKIAWILTPIASYDSMIQETMETAMSKLRECLDCEIVVVRDGRKQLDTKAAGILLRIYEMLDKRKMGDYEQRKTVTMENKTMNAAEIEQSGIDIYTGDDVNERIKEKPGGGPQAIEVAPTRATSEQSV